MEPSHKRRSTRLVVYIVVTFTLPIAFQFQDKAMEISKNKGENVLDPASVSVKFGSYEEKRQELFRHRRKGVLAVEDPFDLPKSFKVTRWGEER